MLVQVCCAALAAAEAEADPAVVYSTYGHQGLYQPGYSTYRYPAAVRAYAAPLTTRYSTYSGFPAYQHGYAAPSVVSHQPYGYAASGRYLADSVGALHIAKREAEAEPEAEADPAVIYKSFGQQALFNPAHNTYNSFPSVYSTPYNTAYNTPYNTAYNTAYKTYTAGYPATALRSYAPSVSSYPLGSVYSGYRNFVQPAHFGGYAQY